MIDPRWNCESLRNKYDTVSKNERSFRNGLFVVDKHTITDSGDFGML